MIPKNTYKKVFIINMSKSALPWMKSNFIPIGKVT